MVIALGDEFRGDDGVGPAVARALHRAGLPARILVSYGDPVELIDWWRDARVAVIVDAVMRPDPRPGRVHVLDPSDLQVTVAGTHGFDVGAAIALGRALDRMPDRLVIVGVEIADLGPGRGLSRAVTAAAPGVARAVVDVISGEPGSAGDHSAP
ncbi:hydrogenase maturation protease [Rhodococcus olei]|uniref:Hydrogenase maturation protease n=1 Tax=Rhodococcus olei TaxID=2161675 RepID=A0ABP8PJ56_9NOCA